MKSFKQFQEEMNKKVPPVKELGGGGGGTNSITDTAPGKSLKKRIKDVGKLATVPFRAVLGIKSKPDPTEKCASGGVASLALKAGSKLIPALITGIGADGTIMQARKYKTRKNPTERTSKRKIGNMEKEYYKKERKKEVKQSNHSDDMIVAKQGEAQKQNKLIDKYIKKQKSRKPFDPVKSEPTIEKPTTFTGRVDKTKGAPTPKRKTFKKANQFEDVVPTNNVGGGQIAGTVEAGDNPPVRKKKPPMLRRKTYAKGGVRSRKPWLDYLKNK